MGLPHLSMRASINVQDKRLSMMLTFGYVVVLIYGIMNVFYHAEYFKYLPVAPVSQGGYVADDLGYDPSTACASARNAHCAHETDASCTVITPDEVVHGGTVYQRQLYITTKIDVLTHIKTCLGNVVQDMCVGICDDEEADRFTLFTAGLEGMALVNSHASKDPHDADESLHHCDLKGSMAVAPISSGPCVDSTSAVVFDDNGKGSDGTCYTGDQMTVGQLLRNVDLGAEADEQLLGANGELKDAVRNGGAAVHVKIVYSNTPYDRAIRYTYNAQVVDRDPYVTARRETTDAGAWLQQSDGVWIRNETVLMRHGVTFTFSQEGLVGASNLNTLAVHLIAINGMLSIWVSVVTFVAKKAFKYEDAAFIVQCTDTKTNKKRVEVFNGHGHSAVPDPDDEADGAAKQEDATANPAFTKKGDEF